MITTRTTARWTTLYLHLAEEIRLKVRGGRVRRVRLVLAVPDARLRSPLSIIARVLIVILKLRGGERPNAKTVLSD